MADRARRCSGAPPAQSLLFPSRMETGAMLRRMFGAGTLAMLMLAAGCDSSPTKAEILKKAAGVFGDKGFIGTDYITTPIRKPECRELLRWEHEWNNRVSSFRAPVERAVATLKTWRILFTDYRRPLKTFKSSFRAATGLYFFKETFA